VLIGRTLKGRYRIYERLGVGGAATVYLGRDIQTGQMIVVKLIHSHLADEQFIGRFKREIDLLQKLDNPHIIALYDWAVGEYDPQLEATLNYIVAEFVEGHTLADIIDTRGSLPEFDALAITRQIALGLADIHSRGIVHRDIKAQNIMITPDNQAKLIDFGIAKGKEHSTLTRSSHFAGTLYYAPPEQILESHAVDHRADLYALGVVLYEMLTASLPVKAREMGTVASKIIAGDLDPVTGVSEPVEDLVNYMLATDVKDRISSANEVIAHIDTIIGGPHAPQIPERAAATATMTLRVPRQQAKPTAPLLTYVLATPQGDRIRLKLPETIIGRSHPRHSAVPDIDLVSFEPELARTVSRRHCRIFCEDNVYYLEDLGSMNGTFLNGAALEAGVPTLLKDGDVVAAGQIELTFTQTGQE
jgi:serine/threonine-protein kinase